MSGHVAAYAATGLSILSILLCFLFVPILWTKMNSIESQLRLDMDEFKVLEDEVWQDWMQARRDNPDLSSRRMSRQAPYGLCRKF